MPTIIEELAMTLKLDPKGFEQGAQQAEAATDNLLQKILASLQQIERETTQTAANTTRIHRTAADEAADAAEKAAKAQEGAANRAAKAKEDAAKKAAREEEDAAKKAAQSHKQAASQAEEAYHKTANAIRRVGVELLAMLGISLTVSAVEKMFAGINKANTEAGYLARNINLNVEQLSAWQQIAERVGGTAEGVAEAFTKIAQQQNELTYRGTSTMVPATEALFGVNLIGADGKILSGDAFIDAVRAGIKRKGMSNTDIAFNAQEAGFGGLTPLLQASDADLARQRDLQKRSGATTTDADSKAAQQLTKDLGELQTVAMGIAKDFWRELGPAIDNVVRGLRDWIEKNEYWLRPAAIAWGKRIGDALTQLAKDFKTLMEGGQVDGFLGKLIAVGKAADDTAKFFGGWGEAIKLLAEIWAAGKVIQMVVMMERFAAAALSLGRLSGLVPPAAPAAAGGGAGAGAGAGAGSAVGGVAGAVVTGTIVGAGIQAVLDEKALIDWAEAHGYKVNKHITHAPDFVDPSGVKLNYHQTKDRWLEEQRQNYVPPAPPETGPPKTGPIFGPQMTPEELERKRREREGTPAVRSPAKAMADAQAASDAVTSQADAARKLQDAADDLSDAADNLKDATETGTEDAPSTGFFGRILQRLGIGGGGAGAGAGGGGGAGGGSGSSGGVSNIRVGDPRIARGALKKNQVEAYNAAIAEGMSDSSARAMVANMSGEALSDPGNVHWDGSHWAHGIVQWDDERSAKIKERFGKAPQEMTVAEQVRASIWEMRTNPRFKKTWDALKGEGSTESKVGTLVSNYEVPGDIGGATGQRLELLKGLPEKFPSSPGGAAPADTPTPAPTRPTPAFTPEGDPVNYPPTPLPAGLFKPPLTASPAARETLEGSNAARRDDWATKTLEPVGASTAAQGWQMNNDQSTSVDQSSRSVHIGSLHVHSAADDAAGIANDIHREIRRYDYATQADTGLA
jgi:hypothetical protein